MDQSSLILYAMIAVVLIGIPVILARRTGKKPMEMLFGKRAQRGLFGTKKTEVEDSKSKAAKQTNSTGNDMLDLLSKLATYARRNHFRLIIPGTLSAADGTMAVLTALVITRSRVVGINCFGFGGRVVAARGDEPWTQVMNGVEKTFPSPVLKNREQEKVVRQSLQELGHPDADVEIIGVFTSPTVWLSDLTGTNCYSKTNAMKYLQDERFKADRGLDPKALEEAMEPRIVRAKNKKEEPEQ